MEAFYFQNQHWVLDGAHTPDSLALTVESFLTLYGGEGIVIFGTVMGKPVEPLAEIIVSRFKNILISRAGHFKPEDPKKVFAVFQEKAHAQENNPNIFIVEEPSKAFLLAKVMAVSVDPVHKEETPVIEVNPKPVLVTGSFYMLDEIRKLLNGGKPC